MIRRRLMIGCREGNDSQSATCGFPFGRGIFLGDGHKGAHILQKNIDQIWAEVFSALLAYPSDGTFWIPRTLINPVCHKRIEYVGQGANTSIDMDLFAFQSMGITCAVPFFVMLQCDDVSRLKDGAF